MGKKARKVVGSRKNPSLHALFPVDKAAEEEILQVPAVLPSLSSTKRAPPLNEEEENTTDAEEDELEQQLVQEMRNKTANAIQKADIIYDSDAMQTRVKEWYGKPEDSTFSLPWAETLETDHIPLEIPDVHDDLKRELAFYQHTLASVREAKAKLKLHNIPYRRPSDYFAEMLKSDEQMARIKDKLIYEQKKIHAVEERKQAQTYRKVAKDIQAKKLQERQDQKKKTLESVKQWKKMRKNSNGGIHDVDDKDFDAMLNAGDNEKARKREYRDKKYGFGGKKRGMKRNTRESTDAVPPKKFKKTKKSAASVRPGKARRAQKRQRLSRK